MTRVEKHHYYKRSLEARLEESRFLGQLRPSSKIEREVKPRSISFLKHQYGEILVGEIIETRSGSHYVIRKTTEEGLEASPLGEYRGDRPHIVTLPNDASGIVAGKRKITSRHRQSYKNILLEINEGGGNVEIPLENKGLFDIF